MTLRATTENAGHVGDEHEWSWSRGAVEAAAAVPAGGHGPELVPDPEQGNGLSAKTASTRSTLLVRRRAVLLSWMPALPSLSPWMFRASRCSRDHTQVLCTVVERRPAVARGPCCNCGLPRLQKLDGVRTPDQGVLQASCETSELTNHCSGARRIKFSICDAISPQMSAAALALPRERSFS